MSFKSSFYSIVFAGAILCVCAVVSSTSFAENAVKSEQLLNIQADIRGTIENVFGDEEILRALEDGKAVHEFYARRGFEPYWVSRSRIKENARDFVEIIEQSWSHGLNPYSYNLRDIRAFFRQEDKTVLLAGLDVLLTDAYVRLGRDLTGIRVDPDFMKSHRRYWRPALKASYLLERLDKNRNIQNLIGAFEPQGRTYKKLQRELISLVEEEPKAYEAVLPIRLKGQILRPMQRDPSVPDLRLRLGAFEPHTEDPYLYDDRLAEAVIKFQREYDLKDDGLIGRQTLAILNQSRELKIHQIIANLERLRWVEEERPDKFVIVNVPSARLWAVDDGEVQFEMPVIVGRKKRPTNIFRTEIHGVRLNPDWTVPPTIKKDDILPKLQEDPEYLTHKGMTLTSGRGEQAVTLDPLAFDWENMTEEELKTLRMVQTSGAHNPLGSVRVLMPNPYNIYLHDTNERHYFERANRAISSGCVRLWEPERMANFILGERNGWDENSLSERLENAKTQDLYISEPIPVYLLYYTAWLNGRGDLVYGHDLYGFDHDLIKMLEDIDGIFIPMDNT